MDLLDVITDGILVDWLGIRGNPFYGADRYVFVLIILQPMEFAPLLAKSRLDLAVADECSLNIETVKLLQ